MIRNSERIPAAVRAQFRGTPLEAMLMNVLRELSPITWVHGQAPPFLLIHGTEDPVVPYGQSVEMCKALRGVGAECELVAVPWGGHGMRRWRDPGYQGVMVDWLRGRLS
jgi:alpha-L-fucosidase 2